MKKRVIAHKQIDEPVILVSEVKPSTIIGLEVEGLEKKYLLQRHPHLDRWDFVNGEQLYDSFYCKDALIKQVISPTRKVYAFDNLGEFAAWIFE